MAEPPRLKLITRGDPPAPKANSLGDPNRYLTIAQAAERMRKMGPAFEKMTAARVRGLADRGLLPFIKIPGFKERVISENELVAFWRRAQLEASKAARRRAEKRG